MSSVKRWSGVDSSTLGEPMSEIKCANCERFFSRYTCGATLFGECDCPKCQGMCSCGQVDKFDAFWASWPKSPRKGAKSSCRKRWDVGLYNGCADQIIKHVEWMKTTDQWRKDNGAFIPAPLVYLNQQRWDGAEVPEAPKQTRDPALVKIEQDQAKKAPPPPEVRARLKAMLGR
jgi:hypothetical protein